jgi:hypothetical protein
VSESNNEKTSEISPTKQSCLEETKEGSKEPEEEVINTGNRDEEPRIEEEGNEGEEGSLEEDEAEGAPEEEPEDQYQVPWENLTVAKTILIQKHAQAENKEEFNKSNWNLLADITERLADLEVQRENIKDA